VREARQPLKAPPLDTVLAASLRIVVDEAGNPDCGVEKNAGKRGGFLVAAVAIPEEIATDLLQVLPRGADGRFLKSSSRELSPEKLVEFLRRLPIDRISVAILAIATKSDVNASISAHAASVANAWRQHGHRRRIAETSLVRILCDLEAINNVWAFHSTRQVIEAKRRRIAAQRIKAPGGDWVPQLGDRDSQVSFMSVKIDEGNHTPAVRREVPEMVRKVMHGHGVDVRPFSWTSESEEPLLAIPDLLAGMLLRHGERRDLSAAMQWVDEARKADRIRLQDGKTIRIPEPPPSNAAAASPA
jgi:hypothetical protein